MGPTPRPRAAHSPRNSGRKNRRIPWPSCWRPAASSVHRRTPCASSNYNATMIPVGMDWKNRSLQGKNVDKTHDLHFQCWVTSANGHDQFPIQNLPFGIFAPDGGRPRGGIAIGDSILDVGGLLTSDLLDGDAKAAAAAASGETLNPFLALGGRYRRALRRAVSELLSAAAAAARVRELVHAAKDCTLYMPA